jgi:hypothetical protein
MVTDAEAYQRLLSGLNSAHFRYWLMTDTLTNCGPSV